MTARQVLAALWHTRAEGAAIFAVFGTFYVLACVLGA